MTNEQLRFPIGTFQQPEAFSHVLFNDYVEEIAQFPAKLKAEVFHLSDEQLDTPYRPDGWTIRQVVNHCADSHMNSLTRFKLALTEDNPTIKPYMEDRWAELADSKTMPIEPALLLLEGLHARWTVLLRSLTPSDLKRSFYHPEQGREIKLEDNMGLYAWHCRHHLAHITTLKKVKGWE